MFTQENEKNVCLHKDLYLRVHSNIIHNRQKLEATEIFIKWWVDTQIVYQHSRPILVNIKKQATDTWDSEDES